VELVSHVTLAQTRILNEKLCGNYTQRGIPASALQVPDKV
jgi:hypothetical protein